MKIRSALGFLYSGATIAAVTLVVACGGGGSSSGTSTGALPAQPSPLQPIGSVSLSIRIPSPPAGATRRRPNYISSGTQSIGVVVTNQGMAPNAAVFTNISACPSVAGVETCTVNVLAVAGSDVFTITAYSGTNGTGSALSQGSVTATIPASGAVPTVPIALGGVIASIALTTVNASLPLSQSMIVNVVAKDASDAMIVGTYDNPIVLSGSNLNISATSLANSTAASAVNVAWTQGYLGTANADLSATADNVTGTLAITPASGFAYYTTGTNSATDWEGFKMILGGDGKLYYSSLGLPTCGANGFCFATGAGLHQFNPTTLTDIEVPIAGEAAGLTYATDGSVWWGGGPSPAPNVSPPVYRMAPGSFNAASLTTITMPGTFAGPNTFIRSVAEDNVGNMWIADVQSARYLKIPLAGPYTTASVTAFAQPAAPAGTDGGQTARTVNFASGEVLFGFSSGYVNVVNPSTGAVTAQYVSNLQTSLIPQTQSNLYDSGTDGTTVYYAQFGDSYAMNPVGDLESFIPSGTFTTLPTIQNLGTAVDLASVAGGLLYYSGFTDIGVANPPSGQPRDYPIEAQVGASYFYGSSGMAALPDGTAWFTCSGNPSLPPSGYIYAPICVGHTIYLSTWGLWPGSSITLYGAGPAGAQIVGIMEAASANSGPFSATSSNTGVCTVTMGDHNLTITGVAAGACTVTVTDAHSVVQNISVTVTTTTGTVHLKHRGGIPQP